MGTDVLENETWAVALCSIFVLFVDLMSVDIVFELVTVPANFQRDTWQGLMPGVKFLRVGLVNDSAVLGDWCDFVYELDTIKKVTIQPISEYKCNNIEYDDHSKQPCEHSGDIGIIGILDK